MPGDGTEPHRASLPAASKIRRRGRRELATRPSLGSGQLDSVKHAGIGWAPARPRLSPGRGMDPELQAGDRAAQAPFRTGGELRVFAYMGAGVLATLHREKGRCVQIRLRTADVGSRTGCYNFVSRYERLCHGHYPTCYNSAMIF